MQIRPIAAVNESLVDRLHLYVALFRQPFRNMLAECVSSRGVGWYFAFQALMMVVAPNARVFAGGRLGTVP